MHISWYEQHVHNYHLNTIFITWTDLTYLDHYRHCTQRSCLLQTWKKENNYMYWYCNCETLWTNVAAPYQLNHCMLQACQRRKLWMDEDATRQWWMRVKMGQALRIVGYAFASAIIYFDNTIPLPKRYTRCWGAYLEALTSTVSILNTGCNDSHIIILG